MRSRRNISTSEKAAAPNSFARVSSTPGLSHRSGLERHPKVNAASAPMMDTFAALAVAAHALSAIYWPGCTFVSSRIQGVEVKSRLHLSWVQPRWFARAAGRSGRSFTARGQATRRPFLLRGRLTSWLRGSCARAACAQVISGPVQSRRSVFPLRWAAVSMVTWCHMPISQVPGPDDLNHGEPNAHPSRSVWSNDDDEPH